MEEYLLQPDQLVPSIVAISVGPDAGRLEQVDLRLTQRTLRPQAA
jgi:hypothetical protein